VPLIVNIAFMKLYLLGLYTARLELFKFFFVMIAGVLIWSVYLYSKYSGSLSKKKRRLRALIMIILSAILLLAMGVSWLVSRTNYGWWFDHI
jgi:hypothetical protein